MLKKTVFILVVICSLLPRFSYGVHPDVHQWSDAELALIRSLWLGSLPPLPDDPSNAYDTDLRAVSFDKKLFSDTRLSANGKVSCETCHIPDKTFTDNLPVAHGIDDTTRRSMPLAGMAYSPWLFWDGRADSLWSQALGPIESPVEHGISRTRCYDIISRQYMMEYETIFGPIPKLDQQYRQTARPAPDDPAIQAQWVAIPYEERQAITRLYANIGKAIAAFVRTIVPQESPFDRYAEAVLNGDIDKASAILTPDQAFGLKLFIGRAQCINCHNSPLFSNNDFHNVGIPARPGFAPDPGRAAGIPLVLGNEFNCLGNLSDAGPGDCAELKYIDTDTRKYRGAFKTPSLRNVADRPPYMHAGQFKNLREVLRFYQSEALKRSSEGKKAVGTDIIHGQLSDEDIDYLIAFLETLSSPIRQY